MANPTEHQSRRVQILLVLAWLMMLGAPARVFPRDAPATAASIKSPPSSFRMTAWWLWFGPAVTRQEVLRELTQMRRAGIGGVTIYPCYPLQVDDPALGIRNLRFLSPEYLKVYRYAVHAAKVLGMTVDVTGGSGWPFGGPSVSLDEASHALRIEKHELLAGGPAQVAALKPGEKLLSVFLTATGARDSRDVTAFCTPEGTLSLPGGAGGQVVAVIATPVGMHVKRPAWGGEGYVLNHLSAPALRHYQESVLDKLVAGVPRGGLRAVFADSMEAYGTDWTAELPDEFERRRGYDVRPLYPLLFDDANPRSADLRFDYWETVADLFVDGFVRPFHQWAMSRGVKSEIQAYGVPAVPQRSYAEIDLPSAEQYDWKNFTEGRWASSAAHFYGKKRVVAEYATWAGIPNRFTDTLSDLKLAADLQFLTGMTELAASTLPYSPPSAGVPGWQDYAGAAFGLNQTWWPFLPRLTAYIQRASYVLEQGKPVSDVLLYLPVEDAESVAPMGSLHTVFRVRDRLAEAKEEIPEFGLKNALASQSPLLATILAHGYTFDGISGDILEASGTESNGRMIVGDGSYSTVILPRLEGMRLGAARRIAEFVRAGGTAIAVGSVPRRVYGGTEPAKNSEELHAVMAEIFGNPSGTFSQHPVGAGAGIFVASENELPQALLQAQSPDLMLRQPDPDLGFVHRRAAISPRENADYYFMVNTSLEQKNFPASFLAGRRAPQLWNLEDGAAARPAHYRFEGDRTVVDLHLGPRRSLVVYFGASHAPPPLTATNLEGADMDEAGIISAIASQAGTYQVQTTSANMSQTVNSLPNPLEIAGPWKLDFGRPLNISKTVTALQSWTANPETQYFSGSATYSTETEIPASSLGPDKIVWIDLGDVRNAARVWVNGHWAGDAWQPPFRLEISRWLKPGRNHLRIEVANLLINCLLGQTPPDYTKLIATYGDRFPYPEDWKANAGPLPAGLLGPVRLVAGVKLRFSLHSKTAPNPRPPQKHPRLAP
jgi:hypothetical protein